jgi:S1-C subfamily serine protease
MTSKRLLRALTSGALPLAALLALSVCAAAQIRTPVTEAGLLRALRGRVLTTAQIVREIQTSGVDFQLTPQVEAELRQAGARPEVIRAVASNYRPPRPSPPPANTPTPTRTPVKAPEPPPPPPITLGAVVEDLTPTAATALGLTPRGVLVSTVEPDGIALRAGLERRDVISSINDAAVSDTSDLRRQLAQLARQRTRAFTLSVVRDGSTIKLTVGDNSPDARADATAAQAGPVARAAEAGGFELKAPGGRLGLRAAPPTPELSSRFKLTNAKGLIVTFADAAAPAAAAGIKPGDVIEKINGKDVRTQEDADKALSKTDSGHVRLRVRRGDDSFNIDLLPRA